MLQTQSPRQCSPLRSQQPAPAPAAARLPQQHETQCCVQVLCKLLVTPMLPRPRGPQGHLELPPPQRGRRDSALTSKDRGASARAWLAMPMGHAVPGSHTHQLLIYQGRLQLQLELGRWLWALRKAWPSPGGDGGRGMALLNPSVGLRARCAMRLPRLPHPNVGCSLSPSLHQHCPVLCIILQR